VPIPHTFDEELHICRALDGTFIPSCTQIMEAQRLSFDFRRYVQPDALDRCRVIGKEVHALTDTFDIDGEVPETWLRPETEGYVESWKGLVRMAGIVVQECSVRMCEAINGFPVTGELDKYVLIRAKYPAIIDLKTGVKDDSHGVQVSIYEMLRFRSPKIGRLIRAVAQLNEDGSPGRLIEFPEASPLDGMLYAETALCAIQNVYFRLRRGLLSERDFIEER
jgi:hypothetical protein